MNGPIAVLAGTPVDTRMGVAYLEERGLPGVPFPLSRGPREQTAFQHAPAADKRRQALAVLRGARLPLVDPAEEMLRLLTQ